MEIQLPAGPVEDILGIIASICDIETQFKMLLCSSKMRKLVFSNIVDLNARSWPVYGHYPISKALLQHSAELKFVRSLDMSLRFVPPELVELARILAPRLSSLHFNQAVPAEQSDEIAFRINCDRIESLTITGRSFARAFAQPSKSLPKLSFLKLKKWGTYDMEPQSNLVDLLFLVLEFVANMASPLKSLQFFLQYFWIKRETQKALVELVINLAQRHSKTLRHFHVTSPEFTQLFKFDWNLGKVSSIGAECKALLGLDLATVRLGLTAVADVPWAALYSSERENFHEFMTLFQECHRESDPIERRLRDLEHVIPARGMGYCQLPSKMMDLIFRLTRDYAAELRSRRPKQLMSLACLLAQLTMPRFIRDLNWPEMQFLVSLITPGEIIDFVHYWTSQSSYLSLGQSWKVLELLLSDIDWCRSMNFKISQEAKFIPDNRYSVWRTGIMMQTSFLSITYETFFPQAVGFYINHPTFDPNARLFSGENILAHIIKWIVGMGQGNLPRLGAEAFHLALGALLKACPREELASIRFGATVLTAVNKWPQNLRQVLKESMPQETDLL